MEEEIEVAEEGLPEPGEAAAMVAGAPAAPDPQPIPGKDYVLHLETMYLTTDPRDRLIR